MHNLYELFGFLRFDPFSDDLYQNGIYTSTGIATITTVILGIIVFYIIKKQRPLTFGLAAWWITILLLSFISLFVAYALSYSALYGVYAKLNQDLPYGFGSFAIFASINFAWSLLFCLITSVVIQYLFKDIHGNVPFKLKKSNK